MPLRAFRNTFLRVTVRARFFFKRPRIGFRIPTVIGCFLLPTSAKRWDSTPTICAKVLPYGKPNGWRVGQRRRSTSLRRGAEKERGALRYPEGPGPGCAGPPVDKTQP